jgi:hypothetical protein
VALRAQRESSFESGVLGGMRSVVTPGCVRTTSPAFRSLADIGRLASTASKLSRWRTTSFLPNWIAWLVSKAVVSSTSWVNQALGLATAVASSFNMHSTPGAVACPRMRLETGSQWSQHVSDAVEQGVDPDGLTPCSTDHALNVDGRTKGGLMPSVRLMLIATALLCLPPMTARAGAPCRSGVRFRGEGAPVTLHLPEKPIGLVFDVMEKITGTPFRVPRDLRYTVTFDIRNVEACRVLEIIGESLSLTYRQDGETIVVIPPGPLPSPAAR